MPQPHLRIIPQNALRYHAHTQSHEVAASFDPHLHALHVHWDNDHGPDSVVVMDNRDVFIAQGALAVRTFSDIQGLDTGQRAQLDRLEVDGVTIGYCLESELMPGEHYTVIDSSVVSAIPTLPLNGFGPATMIRTADGDQPVEWLEPGVRVVTKDTGLQPLRRVIRCPIPKTGTHALLTIRPNEFDAHCPMAPLTLVPTHPVLLQSALADLYFGASDVLSPARYVAANGWPDTELPADSVVTVLMFDTPELICAEGLWVNAYINDPAALGRMAQYLSVADVMSLRHGMIHDQNPRYLLQREEAALIRPLTQARSAAGQKSA